MRLEDVVLSSDGARLAVIKKFDEDPTRQDAIHVQVWDPRNNTPIGGGVGVRLPPLEAWKKGAEYPPWFYMFANDPNLKKGVIVPMWSPSNASTKPSVEGSGTAAELIALV